MNFNYKRTTLVSLFSSLTVQLVKTRSIAIGFLFLLPILLIWSCMPPQEKGKENDRMVAKVFNKSLFQSELNSLVGPETSSEDSTQIANAYVERWVRAAVLMHEAEKYVPNDLNIDELVRDYRASLIRHNYEKLLVEMNLDSTITDEELHIYYETNKEQLKLKQPIVRCRFVKISKSAENWTDIEDWWESDKETDYKKLVDYCSQNANIYMLNDSLWYSLEDISQHLPKGTLNVDNYLFNRNIQIDDDNYEYLLNIFETTAAGRYAPLAYVQNQAKKVILHKRKIQLLEKKKEEMYEKETQSNNVNIFKN